MTSPSRRSPNFRPFDAEAFDVAATDRWLRKLKWPRVTEAQLRKVLMGRGSCHD